MKKNKYSTINNLIPKKILKILILSSLLAFGPVQAETYFTEDSTTSLNSINGDATWESSEGNFVYDNNGTSEINSALLYSTAYFQSEEGFKLTIEYYTESIESTGNHNLSFGLISNETDLSTFDGDNPFVEVSSQYSIGVNLTLGGDTSARGMTFIDGDNLTVLDKSGTNAQFIAGEITEVTLEVGIGGYWVYRINDIYEASGVVADGFDLTKSFHVAVFGQDDNASKSIESIQLEKRYAAGERAESLRGTWYTGITINLLDQLMEADLKTLDGIGISFTDGATLSAQHYAPHKLLETLSDGQDEIPSWGDLTLDEPEDDEFLAKIVKAQAAGLNLKAYTNSEGFVGTNQDYLETFVQNFKDWCDTDADAITFINSQEFHTGIWNDSTSEYDDATSTYPDRKYMFCYAEYVLKDYSIRYGEYFTNWIFDDGGTMEDNGDNATSGLVEEQRIYQAFANAVHAGNPEIPIAFNNGRSTVNYDSYPFAHAIRFDDFTFGHAFGGNNDHASKTGTQFASNYKHITKMTETDGYVHDGGNWTWDDKIVGNFHSKISTGAWKYGATQAWEQDDFNQWNLEALEAGGSMTWDGSFNRAETALYDWVLVLLKGMDDYLYENGVSINGQEADSISVTSLTITSEDGFIELGEVQQFSAEITPSNATDQSVTWDTTNADVVTVDYYGWATGVGVGKANIKARAEDGTISAIKTVRVYEPVDVTSLAVTADTATMIVGSTQQFSVEVTPSDATEQSVTWDTTNADVLTVDDSGVVTAVGAGKANVKARSVDDDSIYAIKTIWVSEPIAVTSLTVTSEDAYIELGTTQQFGVEISPSDATDQSVTWDTTNADVLTINDYGLVTGVSVGRANVKARAEDGTISAIKTVRVTDD